MPPRTPTLIPATRPPRALCEPARPGFAPALLMALTTPQRANRRQNSWRPSSCSSGIISAKASTRCPRTVHTPFTTATSNRWLRGRGAITGGSVVPGRSGVRRSSSAATCSRRAPTPVPVAAEMKCAAMPRSASARRISSSLLCTSGWSSLFTATTCGFAASSLWKSLSSPLMMSRSRSGSGRLPSRRWMKMRARSACRRNSWPRPAPLCAPSMRPGISATTNVRYPISTTPSTGSRVVNG